MAKFSVSILAIVTFLLTLMGVAVVGKSFVVAPAAVLYHLPGFIFEWIRLKHIYVCVCFEVTVMSGVMLDKVVSHKHCKVDDNAKQPNGTDISPPPPAAPPSAPKHQRRLQEVHDTYVLEDSIPSMTSSRHLLSIDSK